MRAALEERHRTAKPRSASAVSEPAKPEPSRRDDRRRPRAGGPARGHARRPPPLRRPRSRPTAATRCSRFMRAQPIQSRLAKQSRRRQSVEIPEVREHPSASIGSSAIERCARDPQCRRQSATPSASSAPLPERVGMSETTRGAASNANVDGSRRSTPAARGGTNGDATSRKTRSAAPRLPQASAACGELRRP